MNVVDDDENAPRTSRIRWRPVSPVLLAALLTLPIAAATGLGPVPGWLAVFLAGAACLVLLGRTTLHAQHREAEVTDMIGQIALALGARGRRPEDAIDAAVRIRNDNTSWRVFMDLPSVPPMDEDRLDYLLRKRIEWRDENAKEQFKSRLAGKTLDDLPVFCRISKAQLNDVVRTTEQAAYHVLERLQHVDAEVDRVRTSTRLARDDYHAAIARSDPTNSAAVAMVEAVEALVAGTGKRQHREEGEQERLDHDVSGVEAAAAELAVVVANLRMLAFNATIECSRDGSDGGGVAVIAAEIARYAEAIAKAGTALDTALAALRGDLTTAYDSVVERTEADVATLQELAKSTHRLRDRVETCDRVADHLFATLAMQADEVSARVALATGHMQTQDIIRQKLETVMFAIATLGEFGSGLVAFLCDPHQDTLAGMDDVIGSLRNNYVTIEQRRTDALLTGQNDVEEEPLPDIELF